MPPIYRHDYHPLSVYGNILSLLREHVSSPGLHLDIGCGYGAIAEPIRDELGLTYIGFDLADDGMASLREREFETHQIDLADITGCETVLAQAIGSRTVVSLSCIDTLEHITNGDEVLTALRSVAVTANALLALSVPNVAHRDLALKLLLGRWDVTEDGLLDHTHVTLYNHSRLARLMKTVGWRNVATRNWPLNYSDQHFPELSPVLNESTPIGQFLQRLISRANPHAIINQFVGIYRPDEPQPRPLLDNRVEPNAPFLSVVISVHDPRTVRLRKLLVDLANQASHDFELVLLHSSANPEEEIQNGLLQRLPVLQGRTRLVASFGLTGAEALNAALVRSSGRYFTILDDAEGLDPAWIETLLSIRGQRPGAVLQVKQLPSDQPVKADESEPVGLTLLPAIYRFARREHGCFATLAIPTNVFHQLGFRFELERPNGCGWDLALDAILYCGLNVSDAPLIAPVNDSAVPQLATNLLGIDDISLLKKLNDHPILLPMGAAERVNALADQVAQLINDADERTEEFDQLRRYARDLEEEVAKPIYHLADRLKDRPVLASLVDVFWPQWANARTPAEPDAPFLSVITRTQGKRPYTLRDTLMSLAGQSCQHFELILVVHSESETVNRTVRDILSDFPPSFQARTNIVICGRPGRSSPLNDGIAHAKGRYVALLDDDDLALGHWVETFERLAADAPNGALLRATCARQDFELTNAGHVPRVPRATSWFKVEWPSNYDPLYHLYANATPPMCVAYPLAVFRDDQLWFDEALNTVEDWDLMTRAAALRGVATTPEVTAIYRWGAASDVSTSVHSNEEWRLNEAAVRRKRDSGPILLPAGSASRIASLIELEHTRAVEFAQVRQYVRHLEQHSHNLEQHSHNLEQHSHNLECRIRELEKRIQYLALPLVSVGGSIPWIDEDEMLAVISRAGLAHHLNSRSWRFTRPLRWVVHRLTLRGGNEPTLDTIPSSAGERLRLIQGVRGSTSWRIAFPIRIAGLLARRARALWSR